MTRKTARAGSSSRRNPARPVVAGVPNAPDQGNASGTRQRVINAAVQCILEQGFYRASSNAIAQTAGLSWGVIQYHFGSREALMLAVLEEGNRRLRHKLADAQVEGDSMTERLDSYFSVLESYYGEPEYLAFIQVLLNLSHDPNTSSATLRSMTEATEMITRELNRLSKQVFADTNVRQDTALTRFTFNALRGLALSEVMLRTLPYDTGPLVKRVASQRDYMTRAVALLLAEEGVQLRSG